MDWKVILTILCLFGALKEFRPSEPFLYKQLTGPPTNFTADEVRHKTNFVVIQNEKFFN